ncbi:helix-turn-helix domain-containing protein [Streptomyces sp. LS1784]|uniref:helix-turn-helix domain-containing protein n=1 Tax=Streptomyces sp. LS1784 TaxID=2851533 RepID=UPI001CCCEA40|nr:helix-turn-helix domain-containing protein [Streptomyces sp. LS1784]
MGAIEASSPLLPHDQAAAYIGRTPKALYCLNDRRMGPPSFRLGGRRMYRIVALNEWLAAHEALDSRSNPELDPTRQAPEPRRAKRRQPLAA